MGVTDKRRNVYFNQHSQISDGSGSSEEGWDIIDGYSSDESTISPILAASALSTIPTSALKPRPPILATPHKGACSGHKLTLKKGRRSIHRYKEERNLFQRYLGNFLVN